MKKRINVLKTWDGIFWATKEVAYGTQTLIRNALVEYEEYKDIEKELGIDLITLFKALNGIACFKKENEIVVGWFCPRLHGSIFSKQNVKPFLTIAPYKDIYLLEDYGKTWALTMGELL